MRRHHGLGRVLELLAGCSLLSLVACQSPGSEHIVGPDGSPMAHVHCGSDQGVCFRLAGELCPSGYEMKPVLSGNDGNFLVRCRSASAPVVAAQCPPPARAVVAAPAAAPVVAAKPPNPNKDAWPPATEPATPAYPWASPADSTAGRSAPSAPSAQAEVDLGY